MARFFRQQPTAAARRELWQRWMLFWYGLFFVSLIIATGLALTLNSHTWGESAALLGLSLLLGVWYGACIVISPTYWQRRVRLTSGYLLIGWGLWFGLINLDPAYLFVLFGLYPQAFVLLFVPWNLIGGLALLFLSLWREVSGLGGWTEAAFFTLGTWVAGMFMALFVETILRQSKERARLIEELEATRQELAQAERQAGTMQERQRLAREIHDTFTQGFTSIVMQLEAVESGGSTVERALDQVQRIARANLMEARRLLWALQPEVFEQSSLPEVLTSLTERWAEESGIPASAKITGTSCSLYPEIEVTLLRTAQEALANVRKHAQAGSVILTVSYLNDMVMLDIQDNGRGFDPQRLPLSLPGQTTGGFGLNALRERVEQLGGTLTLESAPGEGTTLAVALPAVSNLSLLTSGAGLEGCV